MWCDSMKLSTLSCYSFSATFSVSWKVGWVSLLPISITPVLYFVGCIVNLYYYTAHSYSFPHISNTSKLCSYLFSCVVHSDQVIAVTCFPVAYRLQISYPSLHSYNVNLKNIKLTKSILCLKLILLFQFFWNYFTWAMFRSGRIIYLFCCKCYAINVSFELILA
jgi:hypothetical protein